ncbi:hypothetical protein NQ317_019026 [Molorchus minor]|uniref:BTB/POZ domain-containing protein n=1 Tax=Molorchus minor TaxID=1323400 RepID=A0ABQ9JAP6_9CUCU|nr:hypothetical protein NQ317_019026 [Molorchus minor]
MSDLRSGLFEETQAFTYHIPAIRYGTNELMRLYITKSRNVGTAQGQIVARVWFPLNGYCKLNSMQVITRLLNAGFKIAASNGGGVEGQQFSEYLFIRKVLPG